MWSIAAKSSSTARRSRRLPTRRSCARCAADSRVRCSMLDPMIKALSLSIALAALVMIAAGARGGHELPVYPSYYPHEIAIETMPSEHAADLLRDAKLQAYLGAEPRFPGALPASIRAVESLGSFVIVRINPQRPAHDERSACAVV